MAWRSSSSSASAVPYGAPQDPVEAARWYRKSAEQGNAAAQLSLGLMHRAGAGLPKDDGEARKWLREAADQVYADAQLHLGRMYLEGQGGRPDFVQAYMWLDLAASNSSSPDPEKRGQAIEPHDRAAAAMTADKIAEAQRLAREWKPKK